MALPRLVDLGPALRTLRRLAGLRQQEIATRTGFTRGRVSHYERSWHYPALPSLWRLLDALDVDLAGLERAMRQRAELDRQERL